jgi:cell division septation protein DedD
MNDGAPRGIILIAVAVVIGLVLLSSGLDDSEPINADAADADNVATGETDTTETVPVDTAFVPTDVPVVVANGSGVSGAAGAVTEMLVAAGYNPGAPTDTNVPTSETALDTVYYITTPESFEAQAQQVAVDLGLPAESVLEMPATLPVAPEDLGLAAVLVVLGSSPGGLATTATGATVTTVAG